MALLDKVSIPRRTMVLFFIVDASGSMAGSKIGVVNTAIQEVIPAILELSEENADALVKIAALEFSSGARWLTPSGPVPVENFAWNFIDAEGFTDFGAACKALNEKLSTKAFMQEAAGSFAPALLLLSDGEPTDDWQSELDALKKNKWFKAAIKVAIAIGDDANKDMLKEFTGYMEAVLEVHTPAMLKKMIKFVSMTITKTGSKSSNGNAGDEQKQLDVNGKLEDIKAEAAAAPATSPDDGDW